MNPLDERRNRNAIGSVAVDSMPSDVDFRPLTKVEHVLVPVDFSKNSLVGLRYALKFATQFRARITLIHVVDTPSAPVDCGSYDLPLDEKMEAAESRLRELAVKHTPSWSHDSIDAIVRCGEPEKQLCWAVFDLQVDLIVMSTHGFTGLRSVLFGGITSKVIRHGPCPILVVRDDEKSPSAAAGAGLRRLLVPLDFSPRAEAALRCAAMLAEKCHGEVSLIHVIEPSMIDRDLADIGARFEAYHAGAVGRLHSVETRALPKETRGTISVRCGRPFTQILAEAHRLSSDLIVITTHGRTGLAHLLMGSTAERLIKHSPCPVVVVREPIP